MQTSHIPHPHFHMGLIPLRYRWQKKLFLSNNYFPLLFLIHSNLLGMGINGPCFRQLISWLLPSIVLVSLFGFLRVISENFLDNRQKELSNFFLFLTKMDRREFIFTPHPLLVCETLL